MTKLSTRISGIFNPWKPAARRGRKIPAGLRILPGRAFPERFFSARLSPAVLTLLCCAGLIACSDSGNCITANQVTQFNVNFVQIRKTTNRKDTARVFFLIAYADTFQSTGKSFLRSQLAQNLTLPLNPNADQTTFVFVQADSSNLPQTLIDTVQVSYQRQYQMLSTDCAPRVNFSQINVKHTAFESFDSINVLNGNTIELYVNKK